MNEVSNEVNDDKSMEDYFAEFSGGADEPVQEPAQAPVQDEPVPEAPQQAEQPQQIAPPAQPEQPLQDIWAGIPEQTRSAIQQHIGKLEHQFRSESHRTAGLNATLAETREQNEKLQQQIQQFVSAQQSTSKPEEQPKDPDLEKIAADFPDLANVLKKYQTSVDALVEKRVADGIDQAISTRVAPIEQRAHMQEIQQAYVVLKQQHPDIEQVVAAPLFKQWIAAQPPGIQAMYKSPDVSDVSRLISDFKGAVQAAQRAANYAKHQAELKKQDEIRQQQTAKREKKLTDSAGISSGARPPAPAAALSDFDSSFNQFASQSDKRRGVR